MSKKRKYVSSSSSDSESDESSASDSSLSSSMGGSSEEHDMPRDDLPSDSLGPPGLEESSDGIQQPASKSGGRTDYWCYTLNNPSEDDILRLKALHTTPANRVVYHVFQLERAPDTNTRHVQGFIAFGTRVLFQTAKKRLSDRVHLEVARGTPAQNTKYCTKVLSNPCAICLTSRVIAENRALSLSSSELNPLRTPQEKEMIY